MESLSLQRCANCGHALDTRIYVSGTRLPCPACGLTITVSRSDVSQLRAARPVSNGAPAAAPPPPEPAHSPASQPTLDDGETLVRQAVTIPGYELEEMIGRGGMGEVWRARQTSLGREVAVKLLAAKLAREADFVKRFEKEAAALAALSHPGIVQIIDRGVAEGVPYFVMEFVHGRCLRDLVEAKTLPSAEALKIVVQVAAAIESAHARGVIHRDLKPENILIDTEGRVKVADFGLAGIRDEKFNVTATAMTMGTLNYMAPEQRKDAKNVDARADIYSLGVVLYELLTGDVPIGHFRLPSERVPGLDARIDAVVLRALENDRAARFPSAAAMAQALEGMLSTVSLQASSLPDAAAPLGVRPHAGDGPAPGAPHTRPDAPAALHTHPPEKPSSTVITHVRKAGHTLRNAAVSLLVLLGGLALVTVVTGKPLVHLDDSGLTVLGISVSRAAKPEALPEPLPADHRGDLNIALTRTESGGDLVVQSALGPGNDGSLIAWDGEWTTAEGQGLQAREFGRFASEGERPRATLEGAAFELRELSAQVQVQVDPTPPRGYRPKTPRATLFFRSARLLLELTMELGAAPVYRLTAKYNDESGHLQAPTSGDVEFNRVAPPPPGKPVVLRLVSKNGQLSVLADGNPALASPMRLPPWLLAQVGRVGVACEEATCQFSALRLEGAAGKDPELPKDDVHEHVVMAQPAPRGPR